MTQRNFILPSVYCHNGDNPIKSFCSNPCQSCRTCNTCEHYRFLDLICMNPKLTGIKPQKKSTDTCSDWEKHS
jgi:hypothetical protein